MKMKLPDSWFTYVEVNEEELTDCEVEFDASPAEPDVNYGGGLDITSVIHKGKDVMGQMSQAEEDNLLERTSEYLNTYGSEDPRY